MIEATNRTLSLLEQLGTWCAWKVCGLWQKRFAKLITDPFLGPKQKRFLSMAETAFQTCTRALKMVSLLSVAIAYSYFSANEFDRTKSCDCT